MNHQYAERLYHKGTMSEGVLTLKGTPSDKDTPVDIPFRDPLGQKYINI